MQKSHQKWRTPEIQVGNVKEEEKEVIIIIIIIINVVSIMSFFLICFLPGWLMSCFAISDDAYSCIPGYSEKDMDTVVKYEFAFPSVSFYALNF